ncbi:uncharacterized protein [Elaeis guineensis]|uniref:uncharacterized protein n=1 Tax=Elaeis guineensis var. tenera TaxID=51953 RepID=UPI003C6CD948
MEHRKKEAMKTLEKAEELFKADDLRGAVMLAEKARCLFPSLPGLLNVLVAYRIHAAARENKLPSGATDWHAVLGVPPSSNPEVIKQQYKSMRHLTHPDKSKSAAAEGAFKLVEQAWSCINSSSSPHTSGSTASLEPQNMTCHPPLPLPADRSGDAKLKPATRNSDGKLVCPYCQAEFGFKIAGDNPVLCKCQRCHGCAVVTPKNKFTDSSSCRQPENGSPPQHTRTCSPPQSSMPNFLLCPFCGTGNSYRVIDGTYYVTCKRCGVPSSIKKDGASFDKSDQTGGASPPSPQTDVALCRKCRTPYDGEIPNNRRILRRCKLCGSWASIKLEIKQIRVHEDQLRTLAAELPNQSTPVVPGSGDEPSDSPTAGDLVRGPSGTAC